MAGRRVHQVLATLGYGDAIGHEVLGIQRELRRTGVESDIFVETVDPRLEHLTRDYRELVGASGPDTLLIHHFSIGSRASRIAYALPDRMVLVYHNITPPEHFLGVHGLLVQQCFVGRRELTAYVDRTVLALGDSEFNRQELVDLGFRTTGVLPVVPDFTHLEGPPDDRITRAYDDGWVNILFVGRVIPNKRIEDLLRFFHAYKTGFNHRARLLLVGSFGGFEAYFAMLQQYIASEGIRDVHFSGQISNAELCAYYDIADVFLCASEHEGFCVPLVEAFHAGVPVLAYASTAVPATMDGAGLLYTAKAPIAVAALIDEVVENDAVRDAVVEGQDRALERLRHRDFGRTLLGFVEQAFAAPVPATPAVAPDFWTQYRFGEWLADVRVERPSAFQALPTPPSAR